MYYCNRHGIDYSSNECPMCISEAQHEEALEALAAFARDSADAVANPGDYVCPGCGYTTLKYRYPRCPRCQGTVEISYWENVDQQKANARAAAAREEQRKRESEIRFRSSPEYRATVKAQHAVNPLVGVICVVLLGILLNSAFSESVAWWKDSLLWLTLVVLFFFLGRVVQNAYPGHGSGFKIVIWMIGVVCLGILIQYLPFAEFDPWWWDSLLWFTTGVVCYKLGRLANDVLYKGFTPWWIGWWLAVVCMMASLVSLIW